jgi:hypothetical protein
VIDHRQEVPRDHAEPRTLREFIATRILRLIKPAGHDYGRAEETAGRLADQVVAALLGSTAGPAATAAASRPEHSAKGGAR